MPRTRLLKVAAWCFAIQNTRLVAMFSGKDNMARKVSINAAGVPDEALSPEQDTAMSSISANEDNIMVRKVVINAAGVPEGVLLAEQDATIQAMLGNDAVARNDILVRKAALNAASVSEDALSLEQDVAERAMPANEATGGHPVRLVAGETFVATMKPLARRNLAISESLIRKVQGNAAEHNSEQRAYAVHPDKLKHECKKARPGDVLKIKNGEYEDLGYLALACYGNKTHPVVIKAESPWGVTIRGKFALRLNGECTTLKEIRFANVNTELDPLEWHDLIHVGGHGHRITRIEIDGGRSTKFREMKENKMQLPAGKNISWVLLKDCKKCRVDHCSFSDMLERGRMINIIPSKGQQIRIDHNHFQRKARCKGNGCETVKTGNSDGQNWTSGNIVEYNIFEECNGEAEIVSVKGSNQIVQYNTFKKSRGSLTVRQADGTLVRGNYFLGQGEAGAGGVRALGKRTVIEHNYFDGIATGVLIHKGTTEGTVPFYRTPKELRIAFNTFVKCETGIHRSGDCGGSGCTILATDVDIKYNFFKNNTVHIDGKRLDGEVCVGNVYDKSRDKKLSQCPRDDDENLYSADSGNTAGCGSECKQLQVQDDDVGCRCK